MDIKLEKKTGWRAVLSKKSLPYLFGVLLAVLVVWLLMKENASTLRVNTATLMVSSVEEGEFNDYVSLSGTVQPITTMQLSPLESGVVERIVAEAQARRYAPQHSCASRPFSQAVRCGM